MQIIQNTCSNVDVDLDICIFFSMPSIVLSIYNFCCPQLSIARVGKSKGLNIGGGEGSPGQLESEVHSLSQKEVCVLKWRKDHTGTFKFLSSSPNSSNHFTCSPRPPDKQNLDSGEIAYMLHVNRSRSQSLLKDFSSMNTIYTTLLCNMDTDSI